MNNLYIQNNYCDNAKQFQHGNSSSFCQASCASIKGTTSLTLAYTGEHGETTDGHTVFGTLRWTF